MNLKLLRNILWGVCAIAALVVVWFQVIAPQMRSDLADTFGHGDYQLVTTDGEPFTEASLEGAPSAVFFGFTHCPDVCPTTLGDILTWQEELGPDSENLNVFFVTVDPERDTREILGDYVSWVPGVTGVTGSQEEISKAIRAFRVYAKRVPLDNGSYTMDHSAAVLLFDENGEMFEPIGYGEGTDRAVAKLKRLIGS